MCFPSYKNGKLITDPQYYLDNAKTKGLIGTVVSKDVGHDLALLQLESLPVEARPLALSPKSPHPGDNVHSIGASGVGAGTLWRYTPGQVRQVYETEFHYVTGQHITSYVVETNSPVNPGDSGGPVVNDHLQLVAVVAGGDQNKSLISNNIDVREIRSFLAKYLESNGMEPEEITPPVLVKRRENVESLIKMLNSSYPAEQEKAAQTLAEMGADAQAAIPALIPLLKAHEPKIHRAVATALAQIGPPAGGFLSDLIAYLDDNQPEVRAYAARMLANRETASPKMIEAMAKAMRDKEPEVRRYAITGLTRFASEDRNVTITALFDALDDADGKVHQQATESLEKIGLQTPRDLRVVGETLTHRNPEARNFAVGVLAKGQVTREVLDVLPTALKDTDYRIRQQAVIALGRTSRDARERVYPLLMDSLRDKEKTVRKAALTALSSIGPPLGSETANLISCLQNDMPEVRTYACKSLGSLGSEAKTAVPAISEALKDADSEVAWRAAEALGRIGLDANIATPALIQAATSPEKNLRREVAVALSKIGRTERSISALFAGLDDNENDVRQAALNSLKELGLGKTELPFLGAGLKSRHPEARVFAATTLSKIGTEAAPLLMGVLSDPDASVRVKAVEGLGEIRAQEAVPKLADMLVVEKSSNQRKTIMVALERIGPGAAGAVPALCQILEGTDLDARKQAATTLAAIGPAAKSAVPALVLTLGDKRCSELVSDALVRIGKPAVPALLRVLDDRSATVRLGVVVTLGKIGPDAKSAVTPLFGRYRIEQREEVRVALRTALKQIQLKEVPNSP